MRLFVAIPLPDEVKQRLEELQEPVEGIRWQHPWQYHLTLRFIGEVDKEKVQAIRRQLNSVEASPFELKLKGTGHFPEKRFPRVLWAGVEKVPSLMHLQQEVEKACQVAGLEPENRSYKPHVTLGKVRGASKGEALSFINRHKQFSMSSILVSEFVLFSSELSSDGARHTPVEQYPLGLQ